MAVVCLGKAWQFKKWPKELFKGVDRGDFVDLFSKVGLLPARGCVWRVGAGRWEGGQPRTGPAPLSERAPLLR